MSETERNVETLSPEDVRGLLWKAARALGAVLNGNYDPEVLHKVAGDLSEAALATRSAQPLTEGAKLAMFNCLGDTSEWGGREFYMQGIEDAEVAHRIAVDHKVRCLVDSGVDSLWPTIKI